MSVAAGCNFLPDGGRCPELDIEVAAVVPGFEAGGR